MIRDTSPRNSNSSLDTFVIDINCDPPFTNRNTTSPAPSPKIKNIKTLKQEIWNLEKQLSAILFYGGEVDMCAFWDPTSNKNQHFFHCFSFWWQWPWFKDHKSKIAFKFWYIYGSVTFFVYRCFLFFHCIPSASL